MAARFVASRKPASGGADGVDSGVERAMRLLALDALAVRVVHAMQAEGLPVLLMKGPLMAQWLYGNTGERGYSDVDILIPPDARRDAERVLLSLGLFNQHKYVLGVYLPSHEEAWRGHGGVVDLHWSVAGIPPAHWDAAWLGYAADAETATIHGSSVPAVGSRGRVLNLALHAATSRPGDKAREDLRRGLARLPVDSWRSALSLSDRAGCRDAFVSGLSLEPGGSQVLGQLNLAPHVSLASALYDAGAPSRVVIWAERPQLLSSGPRDWTRRLLRVRASDLGFRTRARLSMAGAADVARGRLQFALWRRRLNTPPSTAHATPTARRGTPQ